MSLICNCINCNAYNIQVTLVNTSAIDFCCGYYNYCNHCNNDKTSPYDDNKESAVIYEEFFKNEFKKKACKYKTQDCSKNLYKRIWRKVKRKIKPNVLPKNLPTNQEIQKQSEVLIKKENNISKGLGKSKIQLDSSKKSTTRASRQKRVSTEIRASTEKRESTDKLPSIEKRESTKKRASTDGPTFNKRRPSSNLHNRALTEKRASPETRESTEKRVSADSDGSTFIKRRTSSRLHNRKVSREKTEKTPGQSAADKKAASRTREKRASRLNDRAVSGEKPEESAADKKTASSTREKRASTDKREPTEQRAATEERESTEKRASTDSDGSTFIKRTTSSRLHDRAVSREKLEETPDKSAGGKKTADSARGSKLVGAQVGSITPATQSIQLTAVQPASDHKSAATNELNKPPTVQLPKANPENAQKTIVQKHSQPALQQKRPVQTEHLDSGPAQKATPKPVEVQLETSQNIATQSTVLQKTAAQSAAVQPVATTVSGQAGSDQIDPIKLKPNVHKIPSPGSQSTVVHPTTIQPSASTAAYQPGSDQTESSNFTSRQPNPIKSQSAPSILEAKVPIAAKIELEATKKRGAAQPPTPPTYDGYLKYDQPDSEKTAPAQPVPTKPIILVDPAIDNVPYTELPHIIHYQPIYEQSTIPKSKKVKIPCKNNDYISTRLHWLEEISLKGMSKKGINRRHGLRLHWINK